MNRIDIDKEVLCTFLANNQGVTKRAIRMNEVQNPDKFERDAIGALFQASGYTFEDIYSAMIKCPMLFDFKNSIDKIKAIDSLESVFKDNSQFTGEVLNNSYILIKGFINTYFKNYTNNLNGKLYFDFVDSFVYGQKQGVFLKVAAVDMTSTFDEPNFESSYLVAIEKKIDLDTTIEKLIKDIKKDFSDYKEQVKKDKTHTIKQKLIVEDEREYGDSTGIMNLVIQDQKDENSLYMKSFESNYNDEVVIRTTEYLKGIQHTDTYINIKGIELKNHHFSSEEYGIELCSYLKKVIDTLCIKDESINEIIAKNFEALERLKKEYEELSKEDKEEYGFPMDFDTRNMNILNAILESISKGLSVSFDKSRIKIEKHNEFLNTFKKSVLNKKWNRVGEKTYTRTIEI